MNKTNLEKRKVFTWARLRLLIIFCLIVSAGLFYFSTPAPTGEFVREAVKRGDLLVSVSASGTLQPVLSVDVGSEVSGTLQSILVDENDIVKKGQILATLDSSKLKDAITRSKASAASSRAQVLQARATMQEAKAALNRQKQVFKLSGGKVPSMAEMESAEATLARAKANVAVSIAEVKKANANLKSDETNLRKAVIRSPIDGVVLVRQVVQGQTVAASFSAPVLFTLAEDLRKMELNVHVDEADVSSIKGDQGVLFTVSAYPRQEFSATILRVSMGSTISDNVVTYKTVLSVNNDKLLLRPGMTATARITTADRKSVLLVPNAALRFTPPAEYINGSANSTSNSFLSKLTPKFSSFRSPKKVYKNISEGSMQEVWTMEGEKLIAVAVAVGVSNGRVTEVVSGDIKEGMIILTGFRKSKP